MTETSYCKECGPVITTHEKLNQNGLNCSAINNYNIIYNGFIILLYYYLSCFYKQNCYP